MLEEYRQPGTERVVEPAPMYMLNNVLSDPRPRPVAFGSYAQYLMLPDRPVAAKTGTTNTWVDAWTMGFTPQLAVGVWTGNSDNKPMKLADGSITAAPIFNAVLAKGMEGLPVQGWDAPPGLQHAGVCAPSGLLPTPDCPQTTSDLFLTGKAPTQPDNMYQAFEINARTASAPRPARRRTWSSASSTRSFRPTRPTGCARRASPAAHRGRRPVRRQRAGGRRGDRLPRSSAQRVKGGVPITGNARGGDFRAYKLEVASAGGARPVAPDRPEHGEQISNGQLENWDTAGFDGLYTLRLSVMENSGNVQTNDVQVVVDNTPPKVEIVHPPNDQPYVMEDDELVSITADAQDDWEMDRVEFYLDEAKLGESTVAPYSLRWTITMSDEVPALGPPITATRAITNPDGTVSLEE